MDQFEFFVLEECTPDLLPQREQHWIDHFSNNLYNLELYVEDDKGTHNSFFGKKHTAEAKAKMSEYKKLAYLGQGNPNYGKKQPKGTVLKMVQNNSGTKLNVDSVLEIVALLKEGLPHKDIAARFNIGRTVITRIASGTRWSLITGGPVQRNR